MNSLGSGRRRTLFSANAILTKRRKKVQNRYRRSTESECLIRFCASRDLSDVWYPLPRRRAFACAVICESAFLVFSLGEGEILRSGSRAAASRLSQALVRLAPWHNGGDYEPSNENSFQILPGTGKVPRKDADDLSGSFFRPEPAPDRFRNLSLSSSRAGAAQRTWKRARKECPARSGLPENSCSAFRMNFPADSASA